MRSSTPESDPAAFQAFSDPSAARPPYLDTVLFQVAKLTGPTSRYGVFRLMLILCLVSVIRALRLPTMRPATPPARARRGWRRIFRRWSWRYLAIRIDIGAGCHRRAGRQSFVHFL